MVNQTKNLKIKAKTKTKINANQKSMTNHQIPKIKQKPSKTPSNITNSLPQNPQTNPSTNQTKNLLQDPSNPKTVQLRTTTSKIIILKTKIFNLVLLQVLPD
jgi:hypothetical protein